MAEQDGPDRLGQAIAGHDPLGVLEELARKCIADGAKHLDDAIELGPDRARVMFQVAADELRTAAKAIDTLRVEAGKAARRAKRS